MCPLLVFVGGRSHLLRRSMSDLEQVLDADAFFRIQRSTIVNLARVRKLEMGADGEYRVVLDNATNLRLSRRYGKELQARLGIRE
jgi:two-component system LytT family response regulator